MEIFSPIGLLQILKKINYDNVKLKLMQMQKKDSKLYSKAAKTKQFSSVPYTKLCQIKYMSDNLSIISYRNSFNDNFSSVNLIKSSSSRKRRKTELEELPEITVLLLIVFQKKKNVI